MNPIRDFELRRVHQTLGDDICMLLVGKKELRTRHYSARAVLSTQAFALDGQAFVVGPNVAYDPEDAVPLHGRSAVVSPWGDVLAQCGADADDLAVADVSTDRVAEVRAKLPLADWAE